MFDKQYIDRQRENHGLYFKLLSYGQRGVWLILLYIKLDPMNVNSFFGFATFDYLHFLLESTIYEWNDLFGSKENDRNSKNTKTGNRILEKRDLSFDQG